MSQYCPSQTGPLSHPPPTENPKPHSNAAHSGWAGQESPWTSGSHKADSSLSQLDKMPVLPPAGLPQGQNPSKLYECGEGFWENSPRGSALSHPGPEAASQGRVGQGASPGQQWWEILGKCHVDPAWVSQPLLLIQPPSPRPSPVATASGP